MSENEVAASDLLPPILDSALDAVIVMDAGGYVVEWRGSSELMFGWPIDEAVGQLLRDLIIPARYRQMHAEGLARYVRTGEAKVLRKRLQLEAVDRQGNEFPVELVITPLVHKGAKYFCGFIRDLTESKRAEEAIRALNEELEMRVKERTRELELLNKELEGFTYSIAHDLRTGLRGIVANSNMLEEDLGEGISPEVGARVGRVQKAAMRLSNVIDELLSYARLARRQVIAEAIDLSGLANEAADRVVNLEEYKGKAVVTIEEGIVGTVDRDLFALVVENLIDNSCKYGKSSLVTNIRFGCEDGKDGAMLFVQDDGIGFDMKYAEKLFRPFERLHRDDEYPGTGIGLANVQRIVEMHGGKVWAESEEGVGTKVFMLLPELWCGSGTAVRTVGG